MMTHPNPSLVNTRNGFAGYGLCFGVVFVIVKKQSFRSIYKKICFFGKPTSTLSEISRFVSDGACHER